MQEATRHIKTGSADVHRLRLEPDAREKIAIDGIALVSDGSENTAPFFPDVYKKYSTFVDKDVPVYFYHWWRR